ncbi:MAG: manganese efflux pump MntP family protein, partial [Anaerolineae bacterium]
MEPITIVLLSVGLAMDAFAVSICSGMSMNPVRIRYALRIALFFGLFQALMPVAGWLGGLSFREFIASFDHWIAFGLLAFIGGKMIYEAVKGGDECESQIDPSRLSLLLVLSIATSIDALAAGLSFSVLNVSITGPVIAIGVITAAISFAGVYLGRRCGTVLQSRAQIVGGLILLGIGTRILTGHLLAVTSIAAGT